jgi:hypothetical protein
MKRVLLGLAALMLAGAPAGAFDLRQRSESAGKQFIVFSEDVRLRQSVASFADDVRHDVLQLLGESNLWKAPIVITLARPTTQELSEPPVRLRLVETQQSFKIEFTIKIGDDPAAVNLRQQLLRAVLLEYSYRETGVTSGTVVEPPWWIIEGLMEMNRRRDAGVDSELFRRLVQTNMLPPIEHFLLEKPEELGPTALAVDRALAMALLQLLIEQPGGRENLARFVRHWPQSNGDPAALLATEFPVVAARQQTLQKWWTLNLAHLAAADRYEAMTAEETDKALAPLLQLEITINKAGEKKSFAIGEFDQYLRLPASRAALAGRQAELVALGTRANALLRPVVADYGEIFAQLARGKSRGVRTRLAKTEEYRQLVLQRTTEIADYLNWFEATQMGVRSNAFDNYLKTANELSEQERKQKSPIALYLDELEQEF